MFETTGEPIAPPPAPKAKSDEEGKLVVSWGKKKRAPLGANEEWEVHFRQLKLETTEATLEIEENSSKFTVSSQFAPVYQGQAETFVLRESAENAEMDTDYEVRVRLRRGKERGVFSTTTSVTIKGPEPEPEPEPEPIVETRATPLKTLPTIDTRMVVLGIVAIIFAVLIAMSLGLF